MTKRRSAHASGPVENQELIDESVESIWDHKWQLAFILLVTAFGIDYWLSWKQPPRFRSGMTLMLKVQPSIVIDSTSRDLSERLQSRIPSENILLELIRSDAMTAAAANDPVLVSVAEPYYLESAALGNYIRKGTRVSVIDSTDNQMVLRLSFEGTSSDLAGAAVNAISHALGNHFENKHQEKLTEHSKFLENCQDTLIPNLIELEREYKEFRESTVLDRNLDGVAVNPHRERVASLKLNQEALERRLRESRASLARVKNVQKQVDDPLAVVHAIPELGNLFESLQGAEDDAARKDHAASAIKQYSRALSARSIALQEESTELRDLIDKEKLSAERLLRLEQEDALYRQRIESVRVNLSRLDEQLLAMHIADTGGCVIVTPMKGEDAVLVEARPKRILSLLGLNQEHWSDLTIMGLFAAGVITLIAANVELAWTAMGGRD